MKWSLVFVCAAQIESQLLTLDEFVGSADSFAKHALGTFNVTQARCDVNLNLHGNGSRECFVALVGTGERPSAASSRVGLQRASPLDAIYYTEKNFGQAVKILESPIDAVQLTLDTNPECEVIRYDLEKLADTQLGSGSISITESDSNRVSHGWKVGTSVTYKSPFKAILGGASFTFSADYSGSIATTTTTAVGLRFDVPSGASCTPYLMRFSVMCNEVSYRAQYFRNGAEVHTKWAKVDQSSKPFLMPTNPRTSDFFKVVTGCIDFSRQ